MEGMAKLCIAERIAAGDQEGSGTPEPRREWGTDGQEDSRERLPTLSVGALKQRVHPLAWEVGGIAASPQGALCRSL